MPNETASLNPVGDLRKPIGKPGSSVKGEVRADRGVAARDVEADADNRYLLAVRGDAADGHDVADVAVGHESRALRAARDVMELAERALFVLTEYGCVPQIRQR